MAPDLHERDLLDVTEIGQGSFGTVYKAKGLHDKRWYAIKEVCVQKYTTKTHGYRTPSEWILEIKKEVCEFLATFNSKYVVTYKDCWFGGPDAQFYNKLENSNDKAIESELSSNTSIPKAYLYIKMDYCQSNLREWLDKNNTTELRTPHLQLIFKHILKGLDYIHSLNVIHRDIKPANIMIKSEADSKLQIQIGDFGLSTKVHKDMSQSSLVWPVGNRMYMSPEMWNAKTKNDYSFKADVFSSGLVFYELITPSLTTTGLDKQMTTFNQIREGCFTFLHECHKIELIQLMTIKDSSIRPSAKKVLNVLYRSYRESTKEVNSNLMHNDCPQENELNCESTDVNCLPMACQMAPTINSLTDCEKLDDENKGTQGLQLFSYEILLPADNFQGRQPELKKLLRLLSDKNNKKSSRIILINGLGGIGKTELCKKFLNEIEEKASRIWLHGDTRETLNKSLEDLEKELKSVMKMSNYSLEGLCKMLSRNKEKLVVIIDNVDVKFDEATEIVNLVNKHKNLFIIVTSRKHDLLGFMGERIELKTLNDKEAKLLLQDSLENLSDFDANKLCKLVGNLPLALQQAVAYIREQRKKRRQYKIIDYTKELESMLEHQLNEHEHDYKNTTRATWEVTWKVMTEEAKILLEVLAHLDPDKIEYEFLKHLCFQLERKIKYFDEALVTIINYSLVKEEKEQKLEINRNEDEREGEFYIIHRLVQRFIRCKVDSDYPRMFFNIFLPPKNRTFVRDFWWGQHFDLISELVYKMNFNYSFLYNTFDHYYCMNGGGHDFLSSITSPYEDSLSYDEYTVCIKAEIANQLLENNKGDEALAIFVQLLFTDYEYLQEYAYNQILTIKNIRKYSNEAAEYLEQCQDSQTFENDNLRIGIKIRLANTYGNIGNLESAKQLFKEIRNFYCKYEATETRVHPKIVKLLSWEDLMCEDFNTRLGFFAYFRLTSQELERLVTVFKSRLGETDSFTIKLKKIYTFKLYWNMKRILQFLSRSYYNPKVIQNRNRYWNECFDILEQVMVSVELYKPCPCRSLNASASEFFLLDKTFSYKMVFNIGCDFYDIQHHKRAKELQEMAVNFQKEHCGENVQDKIFMATKLARTYEALGEFKKALELNSETISNPFTKTCTQSDIHRLVTRGDVSRVKVKSDEIYKMTSEEIQHEFYDYTASDYYYFFQLDINSLKSVLQHFVNTIGNLDELTVKVKTKLTERYIDSCIQGKEMLSFELLMQVFDSTFTSEHEKASALVCRVFFGLKNMGNYIDARKLLERYYKCPSLDDSDICFKSNKLHLADLYVELGVEKDKAYQLYHEVIDSFIPEYKEKIMKKIRKLEAEISNKVVFRGGDVNPVHIYVEI